MHNDLEWEETQKEDFFVQVQAVGSEIKSHMKEAG